MDKPNHWNKHCWGQSRHLYMSPILDVAYATGKKGGGSSLHVHRYKSNTFLVIRGNIEIRMKGLHTQRVMDHESFTVPAGVPHRMVFMEDSALYEIYVADENAWEEGIKGVLLEDIERFDPGWNPGEREIRPEYVPPEDLAAPPSRRPPQNPTAAV